jgi:hypothetical protein
MPQSEFIFVKTIEKPLDKFQKTYTKITDHENKSWSFFRNDFTFEVNKCYELTYELNAKGYPDVQVIKPLANIFQQKALAEMANRNDVMRNLFMSLSYSKDLVAAGKLELANLMTEATLIYDWVNQKATEEIAAIQTPKQEIK